MADPFIPSLDGMIDHAGNALTRLPDEIAAGANTVLFNADREVLLQRRADNGYWGLPGGRQEIGESSEQCAIRETFEETGITVSIKRLVGVYSDPRGYSILHYPSGHMAHYVILVYEGEYVSGEPTPSEESTEVHYFPLDALPASIAPAARIRAMDAAAGRPEAFIR